MFSTLLNNLALISVLVIMYLASMLTNTVLGLYNNISNIRESFSKEKLISGLVKGGITLIGALAIASIISLLPDVLLAFGIQSEGNILESISVAAMGGVIASSKWPEQILFFKLISLLRISNLKFMGKIAQDFYFSQGDP